jgi:SAM-dependent methyltransferase
VTWYQEWFGEAYLELYAHRDNHEARQQVAFFRERLPGVDGLVLDLACGMGRHLTELNCDGFMAVGCDLSFTLLRTGIDEYGPLPVARADMRSLPFCSNSFGGLVNFFTSFGYFATEEENLRVVQEMARVLRAGGPSRSSGGSTRVTDRSTNGSRSVKNVTWNVFADTISMRSQRCSTLRAFPSAKRSATFRARVSTPPRRA